MENKNKLIITSILAIFVTLIVIYIVNSDFFLANSFALEENRNNILTYFVKYLVIYVGIFSFVLGVVVHNKDTLKLFCYSYLTLLFFLFFIKGIMVNPEPQSIPGFRTIKRTIDFTIHPFDLNVSMPILIYSILVYLLKNKGKVFMMGLIGILMIEPIQLITNFGNFDINDTYQNVVGYLFGVALYFLIYFIYMIIIKIKSYG